MLRNVFTYNGVGYEEGSLKLREVEAIEVLTGVIYIAINPRRQMAHKIAMMAVMLRRDFSEQEIDTIIDGITLSKVDAMWSQVDDDLPDEYVDGFPLVPGGPLTAT